MRRIATCLVVFTASVALHACQMPEGPAGPVGPQGTQGTQGTQGIQGEQGNPGDPGPGVRLTYTGRFNTEGKASVELPVEAGTLEDPPLIIAYFGGTQSGPFGAYLSDAVYDGDTVSYISAAILIDLGDHLAVGLTGPGLAGWYYRLVVVY
jgi:hypothetical protein